MKRVYIVNKMDTETRQKGNKGNEVYGRGKDAAIEHAKTLATKYRDRYVVFESIAAFEPAVNVQEVPIEDEE